LTIVGGTNTVEDNKMCVDQDKEGKIFKYFDVVFSLFHSFSETTARVQLPAGEFLIVFASKNA
jgi:hypothetical protein